MGNIGVIIATASIIGGFMVGYAFGMDSMLNSILSPIPEFTANVASGITFGLGASIGREIGLALVEDIKNEFGAPSEFYLIGAIIALVGIYYGYKIKEGGT